MMGVDLDGTILLLAPAAEPANLRLPRTGACVIGLTREVVIDGTSRKVGMASTDPSTPLE
jgi:hypothetical protein